MGKEKIKIKKMIRKAIHPKRGAQNDGSVELINK
jgi:hypothetical protein